MKYTLSDLTFIRGHFYNGIIKLDFVNDTIVFDNKLDIEAFDFVKMNTYMYENMQDVLHAFNKFKQYKSNIFR